MIVIVTMMVIVIGKCVHDNVAVFFFTFYIFSTNVSKLKFCNLNEVIMLFTKTFDGFVEYICACSRMRAYSKKTRVSVSLWDGLK